MAESVTVGKTFNRDMKTIGKHINKELKDIPTVVKFATVQMEGKRKVTGDIEYEDCIKIINQLRFQKESSLFALERDHGLASIIANISKFCRTGYL